MSTPFSRLSPSCWTFINLLFNSHLAICFPTRTITFTLSQTFTTLWDAFAAIQLVIFPFWSFKTCTFNTVSSSWYHSSTKIFPFSRLPRCIFSLRLYEGHYDYFLLVKLSRCYAQFFFQFVRHNVLVLHCYNSVKEARCNPYYSEEKRWETESSYKIIAFL